MNRTTYKNIVSTLNKDAFAQFTLQNWSIDDINSEDEFISTYQTPKIGRSTFEQIKVRRNIELDPIKAYNLVIPHYSASDLFLDPSTAISLFEKDVRNALANYKNIVDKRMSEWYWPQDGQYHLPNIAVATNIYNKSHSYYFDFLLPWLDGLIKKIGIDATAYIGSYDSYIELEPQKAKEVLINFFSTYQKEIVISFNEPVSVNEFIGEKHLPNGILNQSKNPIESVHILKSKSEIIKEFEHLIVNDKKEKELQSFISKYYKDIFGEHFDSIRTEVWLNCGEVDLTGRIDEQISS